MLFLGTGLVLKQKNLIGVPSEKGLKVQQNGLQGAIGEVTIVWWVLDYKVRQGLQSAMGLGFKVWWYKVN